MDKEKALENLKDVTDILSEIGVGNFIIDGTLLGFHREGDFIDHDTDIDFGVFAEEWDEHTVALFIFHALHKGFNFWCSYGEMDKYFEFSIKRHNIKVDLFFYREFEDKRIFHAFRNGGRTLPDDVIIYSYPREYIETIETVSFRGVDVSVPQAEKVLSHKYGDWQTPKKKWNWADDPLNKV